MLVLRAKNIALSLLLTALLFVPLSVNRTPIRHFIERELPYSIEVDRLLRMGGEGSLSAWFGTLVFTVVALALFVLLRRATAPAERPTLRLGFGLAVLLAMDNAIMLHERLLAIWLTYANGVTGWLPALLALLLLGGLLRHSGLWPGRARLFYALGWGLVFAGYVWGVAVALQALNDRWHEVMAALLLYAGGISLLYAVLLRLAPVTPQALQLPPAGRTALWLVGWSVLFTLATAGFHILNAQTDLSVVDPFRLLFLLDSGQEATIPTFYSILLWLFCAGLLGLVAVGERDGGKRDTRRWGALAALFVFLSLDEAASLHEQLIGLSRAVVSKLAITHEGLLYHAWVVPVGILVLLLFLLYIPFFQRLPRSTVLWFLLSGALFVGGALGFEMIGGVVVTWDKNNDALRLTVETIEELLEMLGLAGFAFALLSYLAQHVAPLRLRVQP
jgi:hypothetical protein